MRALGVPTDTSDKENVSPVLEGTRVYLVEVVTITFSPTLLSPALLPHSSTRLDHPFELTAHSDHSPYEKFRPTGHR